MRDGLRWLAIIPAAFTIAVLATPARGALSPGQVAYWQALHRCEQPSGWHGGFPTYPGGLGIWDPPDRYGNRHGNWHSWAGELGLLRRYPTGADAPPLVQMRVASFGYRRHHAAWGCFATVGRPPS